MFKSLANMLWRKPSDTPPDKPAAPAEGVIADEQTPIYKELAMTEELREALFPKTPQMVSAIFDRHATPVNRSPSAPPASDGGSFPIIF